MHRARTSKDGRKVKLQNNRSESNNTKARTKTVHDLETNPLKQKHGGARNSRKGKNAR